MLAFLVIFFCFSRGVKHNHIGPKSKTQCRSRAEQNKHKTRTKPWKAAGTSTLTLTWSMSGTSTDPRLILGKDTVAIYIPVLDRYWFVAQRLRSFDLIGRHKPTPKTHGSCPCLNM